MIAASPEGDARLYGVGVGPGDPELMTLKAHRLIAAADVVAYPMADFAGVDDTRANDSFARRIAAHAIPMSAVEVPIVVPMRVARFPAQAVYDAAAATLDTHLERGACVVVLCEGDPFFYGSFMYLFARLSARWPVEIVPGVTSMTACAAAAHRPLCARAEPVSVIPASADVAPLRARLAQGGAFAVMKVGRHLSAVRAAIADAGLLERAQYIAHASLPEQVVCPLADAPASAPYFSMVLISGEDSYAGA
ncbi:MAG: precorrin-2 C(20)-methyltransferase [Pseudomonadota bacterium]